MGIPNLFKIIAISFPEIHYWNPDQHIDHLFIDANSIIYGIHASMDKTKSLTTIQYESLLIDGTFSFIMDLIDKYTHVNKSVYISFDGVPPKSKMKTQRIRRYKSVILDNMKQELRKKYGVQEELIKWNTSANIAPGTSFMTKLNNVFEQYIKEGKLTKRNIKIIFSGTTVVGEGEIKFLKTIRDMRGTDDVVCVFSPDADLLILTMTTHKNNILIMRGPPEQREIEEKFHYLEKGVPYIYVSIDKYRSAFIRELLSDDIVKNFLEVRIIDDYAALVCFGGNDIMTPISYLKVNKQSTLKRGGLKILIEIYKKILLQRNEYFINVSEKDVIVNHEFLKELFLELAKSEDYHFRILKKSMEDTKLGRENKERIEQEMSMTPYEKDLTRFEHLAFYHPDHIFYSKYKDVPELIDFNKDKYTYKSQYYSHLFGLNQKNIQEYNRVRSEICLNYMESFIFNLKYYYFDVPDWRWEYRYNAAPMASDIYTNIDKYIKDVNGIRFTLNPPYKPLEELFMILPVQLGNLLPKKYHELMQGRLLPYFPIEVSLEPIIGQKFIYADVMLPVLYDQEILPELNRIKLTKKEEERNKIDDKPLIYS